MGAGVTHGGCQVCVGGDRAGRQVRGQGTCCLRPAFQRDGVAACVHPVQPGASAICRNSPEGAHQSDETSTGKHGGP